MGMLEYSGLQNKKILRFNKKENLYLLFLFCWKFGIVRLECVITRDWNKNHGALNLTIKEYSIYCQFIFRYVRDPVSHQNVS